ncbi:TetR/AcrR family transcriptional regulator [Paenibacillus sp. MMS20-IR301]|uniref:TetR/AcrR family transcriptional regulator n=1 Tax=Paenibacillus sp. MMS20-IR301 TaxID=2895946 RepID=UPI0028EB71F0|nr:TetR/AcrR family transcriptional regulator [Paenibacillus sp. MMS20-IR301]WNS43898.1 TetR/AcrR family transcriptional regulator [Paenibacillus sp. MMS20-IR301]
MPPKAEITREQVSHTAFELTRQEGFELLTARNIALKLKCSTQPVYRLYRSMDEVKEEVYKQAVDFALTEIQSYNNEKNEPAMNLAAGCLLFAQSEKQLFRLLFLSDYSSEFTRNNEDSITEVFYQTFLQLDPQLSTMNTSKAQELFRKLSAYWLGIGVMINMDYHELTIDEAIVMLEEMYHFLKHSTQIRD